MTYYQPVTVYLPPLEIDAAKMIVTNSAAYYAKVQLDPDPRILQTLIQTAPANAFFTDLVRYAVPFPQYGVLLGQVLSRPLGGAPENALTCCEHVSIVWRAVCHKIIQQYNKQSWDTILQQHSLTSNVKKLVQHLLWYSYFCQPITRDLLIEGVKIELLEKDGIIFLTESAVQPSSFTIHMAPIVLHMLDTMYELRIFDSVLFDRFSRLDEDSFPRFILAIHASTYRLLTIRDGQPCQYPREVIYRFAAEGAEASKKQLVNIFPSVSIREAPGMCNNKTYHIDRSNLTHAVLVAEGAPGGIEVVNLKHQSQRSLLVLNSRRAASSDAFTPHGDEQYKFSLYLASGQAIPQSARPETKTINDDLLYTEYNKRASEQFALISPKELHPNLAKTVNTLPLGQLLICGKQLKQFMGVFFTEAAFREPSSA